MLVAYEVGVAVHGSPLPVQWLLLRLMFHNLQFVP